MSSADIPGLNYTSHQYGDHTLQRVAVWQFDDDDDDAQAAHAAASAYWIIFVHGGAWRDPRNTVDDFVPPVQHMASRADLPKSAIRGFASLDYRLSPHPLFPQDPSTPAKELHNARHPDHIRDVVSALRFLDGRYGIGNNYVLIGHSAGGALVHQVVMNSDASCGWAPAVPLPAALISISGIHDLRGMVARHGGIYEEFTTGVFGPDKQVWDAVSPATFAGNFNDVWADGPRLVILANSAEDTLIDMPELDVMEARLIADGITPIAIRDLSLEHDDIWREGTQVADLVAKVIAKLQQP